MPYPINILSGQAREADQRERLVYSFALVQEWDIYLDMSQPGSVFVATFRDSLNNIEHVAIMWQRI